MKVKAKVGQRPQNSRKGYCYLDLFRALNTTLNCGINVDRIAEQFGPYPLFRRVAGVLLSYVERDVLVPGVRLVSPSLFHVDRHCNPVRVSELIMGALFTTARIGADPAIARADNVNTLTALCSVAGLPVSSVMAEAARKQIDKCMQLQESFVADALRPLLPVGQKKFEIPYRMTANVIAELQSAFPELNVVVTGRIAHPHAYAAAATLASEELILRKFKYDANAAVERGYDAAIVDVGANFPRHARQGRRTIHCCVPIIDVRDSARETTRFETLNAQVRAGKLTAATANSYVTPHCNTDVRCYNRAENCSVKAPAMMFVHSQYDVSMDAFRRMLDMHKPRTVISVLNFVPSIFYDDAGFNETLGVNFRRDGDDVIFDFVNDTSMGYRHNLANLKEIYMTQLVVTPGGRSYLCERFTRGCALFLQYTYCSVAPETKTLHANFSFWDNMCEGTVVLATWDYDTGRFTGSRLQTAKKRVVGFTRRYVTVDRRFYDLLYSHCIRSGDKSFNFNECFSAGLTFNTKMCINGNDVRAVNRVSSVDFIHAVVAIYCIAYRNRFQAGKSIEGFVASEKNKRAAHRVGLTNFFGAAWRIVSDAGIFDRAKDFWNDLLESMSNVYAASDVDVALFDSVRVINFSEILELNAEFDVDSYAAFNDVNVTKVMVDVKKDGLLGEVVELIRKTVAQPATVALPNDPVVVKLPERSQPVVKPICSGRMVRKAITDFHRTSSHKTSENSKVLTSIRHQKYDCCEKLVVRPMPPDGHCVFHTLGAIVGMTQWDMRQKLYADLCDDALLIADGSRAGWGSTDAVTAFTRIFNYRVCVHANVDGVTFSTLMYTDVTVPESSPVRHIQWVMSGESGHVDLLEPQGGYEDLPSNCEVSDIVSLGESTETEETDVEPVEPIVMATEVSADSEDGSSDPIKLDDVLPSNQYDGEVVPDYVRALILGEPEDLNTSTLDLCSIVDAPEPFVPSGQSETFDADYFLRKYGINAIYRDHVDGNDPWSSMGKYAMEKGGDIFRRVEFLYVYSSHLAYDIDSIVSVLPKKKCAFASRDYVLPYSLGDQIEALEPGDSVFDAIITTEFDVDHLRRVALVYIVQVPSPKHAESLPILTGCERCVFRAKFTRVDDMTAYVAYYKPEKYKFFWPNWYASMARLLNQTVLEPGALSPDALRLLLKGTSAGGVLDGIEEITECPEHRSAEPGCVCCIYLASDPNPVLVQSMWSYLRARVQKANVALERLAASQEPGKAVVSYLDTERARCASTGFKAVGVTNYSDVDRCFLVKTLDAVTNSSEHNAVKCAELGTHRVECANDKVVHARTYGVKSKLTVKFAGTAVALGAERESTHHAKAVVDLRRVETSAVTSIAPVSVRDASTSTSSAVDVVIYSTRPRQRRTRVKHFSMSDAGVQVDMDCESDEKAQPYSEVMSPQSEVEECESESDAASDVVDVGAKKATAMVKLTGVVKRLKKKLRVGTSVTSTPSNFSDQVRLMEDHVIQRKSPELMLEFNRTLSKLPIDRATDTLAIVGFEGGYPWDTDIHLVCISTIGTRFPQDFIARRGIETLEGLRASYKCLHEGLYFNEEYLEYVLVAESDPERKVNTFFGRLPSDCARISVEISCPFSEAALASAILQHGRKVCLITAKFQSWDGVLSIVDPKTPSLPSKSVPIAFPKMTREELGYFPNPPWINGKSKDDAYRNAMIEFRHTTGHADEFNLKAFRRYGVDPREGPDFSNLAALRAEGVYVYDNEKRCFLGAKPRQKFSHAYSASRNNYVQWMEKAERFESKDRFVLTSRFTELMLNHQITENISGISILTQRRPEITWINGPPGCGKTYTIVQSAKLSSTKMLGEDLVLSMTKEGRESIVRAMTKKYSDVDAEVIKTHVRTVASVLVNGSKVKYDRVLFDEALMAHAGTIGYVAALTRAKTILIIGDVHQIPYVDREHMCELRYYSPACFADISSELSITYRCPMDVTYALHHLYKGLCTKSNVPTSMRRLAYSAERAGIRKDLSDCLYLVHFQADKDALLREGFGSGARSSVLTIHEAQGLTFPQVICIRTNSKALMLYDKMEYAVVAISRHTRDFTYYTDQSDAVTKLMDRGRKDGPWLCDWNSKRLLEADKKPVFTAGGYLFETDTVLTRDQFDTTLNLTSGLPHQTHGVLRPVAPFRVVNCLGKAPSWKGAQESDIAYLQAFYDSLMPEVATRDYSWDQMMMESEDTYLRATDLSVIPGRGYYRAPAHGTLRPRLRTIMQRRKVRSQKESLLGAIKRNLNSPELANPSLSPAEIGRALFTNFMRSGIDPTKQTLLQQYREDVVALSSPMVAEWLARQPPGRQAQIVSELPLHLRPYNSFTYMVKTDVKPQLTPSAMNTYPSVQTIIYNDPSVNSIYCPIFNVLFERLMSVLHPKILLLTGLSKVEFEREFNARIAPELARRLRTVENDFSKYDKAQQEALRVLEDLLWRELGLDNDLAEIWDASRRNSHVRDRDGGIAFTTSFQRKSGEATTFSGNTLVAICILLAVFDIDDIVLLLGAGDDTLVYLRDGVEVADASRMIADLFNLECKLLDRYHVPYFCSAFVVATPTWTFIVPDPLKFVTKLGRQDMKNYQHVEEYRVSCIDTMQSLFNAEVTPMLSLAVRERYGGFIADLSKLQSILRTICYDEDLFATLFVHDRGVVIYDPSNKVKERHVTAEL